MPHFHHKSQVKIATTNMNFFFLKQNPYAHAKNHMIKNCSCTNHQYLEREIKEKEKKKIFLIVISK